MSDPNKRRLNWEAKFSTERIKQTLDAKRADMSARYQAAAAALCSMENQVREVLNLSGVQTINYVPYLNFGRQLWKLSRDREIPGDSHAMAAQVLLDKWASRGLDRKVLAKIHSQVFDIGEPPSK